MWQLKKSEDEVRTKRLGNMNMQVKETVNLNEVLYVPKAVKKIFSIFRKVSKRAIVGATQDKIP